MNEVLDRDPNLAAPDGAAPANVPANVPAHVPGGWYGIQSGAALAGRYRIERLISRGGMGAVFEATQLGLDRAVAIKLLLPALSRDEKMQERFRREARWAASRR